MDRRTGDSAPADAGIDVHIRELAGGSLDAAVSLLAEGMRDNPLHVRVFGRDPARRVQRLRRFMGPLVAHVHANGVLLGASVRGRLVGVLGLMEPGRCRPAGMHVLRFAVAIATRNPPWRAARILRWLAKWRSRDPREPHWHLGPMAVDAGFRRRGIARALMTHCCQLVDARGGMAFLEADLEVNARFYESLGFVTTRRESLLGVPAWYMQRPRLTALPSTAS